MAQKHGVGITRSSAPVCFLCGGGTWKGCRECTKEQRLSAEQLQGQESLAGWFWIVAVGAGTSPGAPAPVSARVDAGKHAQGDPVTGGVCFQAEPLGAHNTPPTGPPALPEDDRTARTNIPNKVKRGQWGPVSGCRLEVHAGVRCSPSRCHLPPCTDTGRRLPPSRPVYMTTRGQAEAEREPQSRHAGRGRGWGDHTSSYPGPVRTDGPKGTS